MKKLLFVAILSSISFGSVHAQIEEDKKHHHTVGSFTDSRDGKVYPTITFVKELAGGALIERTWFAENANFEVEGSLCYNDTREYCDKYGRLYNYEQANKACPEGWHVPTIHEWKHLFDFFGGRNHAGRLLFEGKESDMHMLFGGFANPGPEFRNLTENGNWWDNELKDSNSAGIITLKKDSDHIFHSKVGDRFFLSTRCVKFHN